MDRPYYISKKGSKIELGITFHARRRFAQRWQRLYQQAVTVDEVDSLIARCFQQAVRISKYSRKEKDRLKRHGDDTLYFRTGDLTFVVQNCEIVTVEISAKDLRHLNKRFCL